jgi:hypothetical protein
MVLTDVDILAGIFSIIWVVLSTFVGLKIASKYFRVKQRVFLLVGITWVLICSPWWGSASSVIIALFNNGVGLPREIYFSLTVIPIAPALIVWLTAYTDLIAKERQKIILLLASILGIVYTIIFFVLLNSDPSLVGVLKTPVDSDYKLIIMVYMLSVILIILITGTQFARHSLRSDNPEIKLKGKLLLIAFITFSIGALLDSAIPLNLITLPITRIILIISAISFYGGFILPNWMKKILLKR